MSIQLLCCSIVALIAFAVLVAYAVSRDVNIKAICKIPFVLLSFETKRVDTGVSKLKKP
jgi:hypothetical protein